jgi:hypothetical protein
MMELAGQGSYRQLAEEIGEVLSAAAETAEKMQEDARVEAARIRASAEADRRNAYADGRRILDEARMEAEAEWQAQEIVAQARRQAAERMAGADTRIAEMTKTENEVMDQLARVAQMLAESMATLRQRAADAAETPSTMTFSDPEVPERDAETDAVEADEPTAKVYFVEFPPMTPVEAACAPPAPEPEEEIVLPEASDVSLFQSDEERSEWAPPPDEMPIWWTRGSVQG